MVERPLHMGVPNTFYDSYIQGLQDEHGSRCPTLDRDWLDGIASPGRGGRACRLRTYSVAKVPTYVHSPDHTAIALALALVSAVVKFWERLAASSESTATNKKLQRSDGLRFFDRQSLLAVAR